MVENEVHDDDIVKALQKECAECSEKHWCDHGTNKIGYYCPSMDAADLIESLQDKLAEVTRSRAELSETYNSLFDDAKQLTVQLVESQRRERAEVGELNGILGQIDEDEYLRKAFCIHPGNEDCPSEKENGYVDVDDCIGCPLFENSWSGPQAGKGEVE